MQILLASAVISSEKVYRHVARFLNNMENYRLEEDYRNHLVIKLVLVRCSLLYFLYSYLVQMLECIQYLRVRYTRILK